MISMGIERNHSMGPWDNWRGSIIKAAPKFSACTHHSKFVLERVVPNDDTSCNSCFPPPALRTPPKACIHLALFIFLALHALGPKTFTLAALGSWIQAIRHIFICMGRCTSCTMMTKEPLFDPVLNNEIWAVSQDGELHAGLQVASKYTPSVPPPPSPPQRRRLACETTPPPNIYIYLFLITNFH